MLFATMRNKKNVFSILLLAITVFSFLSFSNLSGKNEDFTESVKIALREVGNQLLLSNGDSISLVLPVKEINTLKFSLTFEKQLKLKPKPLVDIVKSVFEKSSLSKNYRVEVLRCSDHEVGYSYEINELEEQTIIPCAGRDLPKSCYIIEVKFLEKTSKISIVKIILYGLLLVAFLLGMNLVFPKNKLLKYRTKGLENGINIGSFQFYPEQHKLIQKAIEIALSKKECELLEIFVANANQIVTREALTKKVWEDNGVIVGRSLDTYISKLRKKLQKDSTIKLTNVHGIGYKLEVK